MKLFSKQVVAMPLPKGHQIKRINIGEYKFTIAYENKMLLFNMLTFSSPCDAAKKRIDTLIRDEHS